MSYEVWVDGSVRPNPGIGGVGVVVKKDGYTITEVKKLVGDNISNNESEYMAVIEGIKTVYAINRRFGNEDCIVYTDSKIIYNQLETGWKINFEHFRKLNKITKELIASCDFNVKLVEIRRDSNVEANDLAQAVTLEEKERNSEKV